MRAFLFDPYRLGFMARALVEVLLLGTLGAIVGVHVALRRLAFVTDAVLKLREAGHVAPAARLLAEATARTP